MNTYGDMMTLLLTFFVLLFAMSTVDAEKFEALASSFHASVSIFDGGQTIRIDNNVLENGMSQFPVKETQFSIEQAYQEAQETTKAEQDIKAYVKAKEIDDKSLCKKVEI